MKIKGLSVFLPKNGYQIVHQKHEHSIFKNGKIPDYTSKVKQRSDAEHVENTMFQAFLKKYRTFLAQKTSKNSCYCDNFQSIDFIGIEGNWEKLPFAEHVEI